MTDIEKACVQRKCFTCFHWEPSNSDGDLGICHRANSVTSEWYVCGMWYSIEEARHALRDDLGKILRARVRNASEGGGGSL